MKIAKHILYIVIFLTIFYVIGIAGASDNGSIPFKDVVIRLIISGLIAIKSFVICVLIESKEEKTTYCNQN